MDKRSKVLSIVFLAMLAVSVVVTFYRYIVVQDIAFYTDSEAFEQSLLEE